MLIVILVKLRYWSPTIGHLKLVTLLDESDRISKPSSLNTYTLNTLPVAEISLREMDNKRYWGRIYVRAYLFYWGCLFHFALHRSILLLIVYCEIHTVYLKKYVIPI